MKTIPFLLIGFITSAASHAATVYWSASIDTGIITSTGAALAQGNWVQIGYFGSLSNSQITADSTSTSGMSALTADFHTFATAQIGDNTGFAGSFSSQGTPFYSTLPGFVPGSQIYLWALNSTNNTSLSTAENSVTQQVIATTTAWHFPAVDNSPPPTIDITSLSSGTILAGRYKSSDSASLDGIFGTGNHALQLAAVAGIPPVPEPATLAIGVMAALAAAGVRTRRRA